MNLRIILLVTASCCVVTSAFAQFTLHAQTYAENKTLGVNDPESNSLDLSGSSGTLSESSTAPGVTTFQTVSATLVDTYDGSVTFDDGWSTAGADHYACSISGVSWYTFAVASTASLDFTWDLSFVSNFSYPGFGLYAPTIYLDGGQYSNWGTPPSSSGTLSLLLTSGSHTIGFADTSNLSGSLGTESSTLNETINFSVNATPPSNPTTPGPAALLPFLSGLAVAARRSRAKK